jgi:hypothetical protein
MFARLIKLLGSVVGNFLYLIGWGLAVLLIGIATILAFTLNPLVPLVLGGIGLIVWVIAIELKYSLTER